MIFSQSLSDLRKICLKKNSVSDKWKKNIFPLPAKKFSVQTEENFLILAPRKKKQLKNQPEKKGSLKK